MAAYPPGPPGFRPIADGHGMEELGPSTAMSRISEIPSDITADLETVVLTGEGGYDGLSVPGRRLVFGDPR